MRRSIGFWLLIALPVIVIAGWIVAWFVASSLSDRYFNAWIEREKSNGRIWACNERSAQGFPFQFRIACNNPTMISEARGGRQTLTIQKIDVAYSPLLPRTARIEITGPARFAGSIATNSFIADWESLEIALTYPWPSRPNAIANLKKLSLRSVSGGVESQLLSAQSVALFLNIVAGEKSSHSLAVKLMGEGVESHALNEATGNAQPAKLATAFELTQFERLFRGDLQSRLEAWRIADGALAIGELNASKGTLALEAVGKLALDAQRRPAGNLNLRAAGLTSLMQRFGLPGSSQSRGGLLGNLIRRPANPAEAPDQAGRFIPLPLILRDGAVWIGPIKSPITLRPIL